MKTTKKWSLAVLFLTFCGLFAFSSVIVFIDPFFHFHSPLKFINYTISNESYQAPGIAKHFEYDAVITGSSVTQNFKASKFKDVMGLNLAKMTYSGSHAKNTNIIINLALDANPNVKKVFIGLDYFAMEAEVDEPIFQLPDYLYDNNPFNDVSYALNKEVLLGDVMRNTIGATRMNLGTTNFDDAYFWGNHHTYSQERVVNGYKSSSGIIEFKAPINQVMERVKQNLEINILPLIKEYPDVEFVIFFPPYNMVYWHHLISNNYFDVTLEELDYLVQNLIEYENVSLFYFQNISEIVTNLDLYWDYIHYNPDINEYMTECFVNKEHILTKENYKDEIEKMRSLALNFDYDEIFKQG